MEFYYIDLETTGLNPSKKDITYKILDLQEINERIV